MTLQSNGLNENKDNSIILESEDREETNNDGAKEQKATSSNDDQILMEETYTPTIEFNKESEAILNSDPRWTKKFIQGLWSTIDYLYQKASPRVATVTTFSNIAKFQIEKVMKYTTEQNAELFNRTRWQEIRDTVDLCYAYDEMFN